MKSLAIAALACVSLNAFAIDLSPECKKELTNQMIGKETKYLADIGASLVSPEVQIWANNFKGISVGGWVEDTTDGRSVRYSSGKTTEAKLAACDIDLKREDNTACRYSVSDDDDFETNSALKLVRTATLKPTTKLSTIEQQQILLWLGEGKGNVSDVPELIANTDDGDITKKIVQVKGGVKLDYYKAYGGDNPYGIFYISGTTTIAGSNGDGDICIGYAVEK